VIDREVRGGGREVRRPNLKLLGFGKEDRANLTGS